MLWRVTEVNQPVVELIALNFRPSSQDLAELLGRLADRDDAAFEQLYRASSAKLFGVILRITGSRERSEEILQEVYLKIWERAADFEPGKASPITWMATIARNRAIDAIRKAGREANDGPDALSEIPDPGPSAADRLETSQAMARLAVCLDELEADHRDAVRLAYILGWSRTELSNRFGVPVATVKTWLHRSLKRLKECLGR